MTPMAEVKQGIFEAAIPGQPAFTHVNYNVEIQDGDLRVVDPPRHQGVERWFGFWVLAMRCRSDDECGAAESCDATGRCRQSRGVCTIDADCGNALRCGADGRCRISGRSCKVDKGCVLGEVCDPMLGECIPGPRCDLGRPCPADYICDVPRGICNRGCREDAQCFAGERCVDQRCGAG